MELVTSGTGAALVRGSVTESQITEFLFFSHTEISRVMSSQSLHGFLFCLSHVFRREKKTQQNFSPKSDTFTLLVSEGFYTFCADISSPNAPQCSLKKQFRI